MFSYNLIVKSMSISRKTKFYRRAVSKFLYTTRNQCGMFCSLYWVYELKILFVSVKLAYVGNILQKNMQDGNLHNLQYC